MLKLHTLILSLFFVLQFSCTGSTTKDIKQISAERNDVDGIPEIHFTEVVNDLGKIKQGERLVAWFDFENTGEAPLIVQNVTAGCGCTVPEWDKDPILPGEKNSIKVIFNSSGKRGLQNIKVSVYSNAKSKENILYLKGQVIDN